MSPSIAIIGKGKLADLVHEQLVTDYPITRWHHSKDIIPNEEALALVLHDSWFPGEHLLVEDVYHSSKIPWLRGFPSFGEAIIGPLVLPNKQGCSQCADMRRFMAGPDRKEMFQLQKEKINPTHTSIEPWASISGLLQTAYLIQEEVRRFLKGEKTRTTEKVILLNLNTFTISNHFFLPNPHCPICSHLPEDTSTLATISLKPCLKTSIDSYRCRSLNDLEHILTKNYLDFRMGLLTGKKHNFTSPFADTLVNLPLLSGNETTAGRTHSYTASETAAILEGLERYCGFTPHGKQTIIRDCYSNVEKDAINPFTIGLHSKEQYDSPAFSFKPLETDRKINWVWGYSFSQNRPILVPEILAYYSLGGGEGFVYETSNGCALGGSLEEAIFYGILEVVERDSFLMTWYGQLPIPRLDPYSTNSIELQLMIQRLQIVTGFNIHLFNSTTENGIPSIWAIAKNTKEKGLNLLCAAGAHLDPVRASIGAIQELAGMLVPLGNKLEKKKETYLQMYHDSNLVHQMDDHSMLYGLKESEERLSFLLDNNRPLHRYEQQFTPVNKHRDLSDDLKHMLTIFKRLDLDVIVVDQTTPELQRNHLYCVKVLIPGMLPMTFGHHRTRLTGLDRVLHVPMQLGYVHEPLTINQLNKHPHPFP